MSARQGYAAREGEVGAGFDFPLPQSLTRSKQDHFVAQVKNLLNTCAEEAELLRESRSGAGESVAASHEDVDMALNAVLNKMKNPQGRSRIMCLLRPVADISYRPPNSWSRDIVGYFEKKMRTLIRTWADETDRLRLQDPTKEQRRAIDQALNLTVEMIRLENKSVGVATEELAENDAPCPQVPWYVILLTGLRIRKVWNWLSASLGRLVGAIMAVAGGAGSLWTFAEKQLTQAGIQEAGLLALLLVGLATMLGGGPRPGS